MSKKKNTNQFASMTQAELLEKLNKVVKEVQELKTALAGNESRDVKKYKTLKKDIARIKTVLSTLSNQ